MSIIYRGPPYYEGTPTSTPWNSGIGTNLTGYQIDSNFNWCASAIEALQAAQVASISNFEIINGSLYITLEDHQVFDAGPLPTLEWNPIGQWIANTAYNPPDEFYYNGAAYVVLQPYPGAATFDPNAQNGSGQNYFSPPIIVSPGSVVPTGGEPGQVLTATSAGGIDVPSTAWDYIFPSGGVAGDFLQLTHLGTGTSAADVAWAPASITFVESSPFDAGQFLEWTGSEWTNAFLPEATSSSFGVVEPDNVTIGISAGVIFEMNPPVAALSATTGTFTNSPDFADYPNAVYTCTPTGDITLNTSTAYAGSELVFVITTSGVTSYNFTFGTNFKSQGALATGTSSGAVFTVSFCCDGINWNETSRTTAM